MAGLTAWQALFDHAHLSSKDTILIHGAARGVVASGYNLLDGLEHMSLEQFSAHNSSFLKDLGVNDVIDDKKTSL